MSQTPNRLMKIRKIQRRKVCDGCKRRKVRCDGHHSFQNPCTSCRTFHIPCTYIGVMRPKELPKDYIQLLEQKVDQMAALLSQHVPADQLPDEFKPATMDISYGELPIRPFIQKDMEPLNFVGYRKEIDGVLISDTESDTDQDAEVNHSNSKTALPPKQGLTHDTYSSLESLTYTPDDLVPIHHFQRIDPIDLVMPSPDLAGPLFTSFFFHVIPFLPVLDRTAFLEQYEESSQSHMCLPSFTLLVRLVCAIGAFYQSDSLSTTPAGTQHHVPGYEFFRDAKDAMSLGLPGLTDIQCRALAALYYHLLGDTHASWIELSIGIRLGQSVGAHRKPSNTSTLQPRDDWTRVFWCLVHLDRHTSRELGRLPLMRMLESDLPLPQERPGAEESDYNLKYFLFSLWSDRLFASVQSQSSVARQSAFWSQVTPHDILWMYDETKEGVNRLLTNLPERWRWDPESSDLIRLAQSAQLLCAIDYTTILSHHLRFDNDDSTPNDNLNISTQSAQNVGYLAVVCARRGAKMLPHAYSMVFASAVVLLTAIWVKQKQSQHQDVETLVGGVGRCVETLRLTERWLAAAGRYVDILRHLASFGDIPINLNGDNNPFMASQPSSIPSSFNQSSLEPIFISDSMNPSSTLFITGTQRPLSTMNPYSNYSSHIVPLLEDWFSQTQANETPAFWNEWSGYLSTLDIIEAPTNLEMPGPQEY